MSFPDFYPAIPASNNSPTQDQPNMQQNNATLNQWVAVDHVGFNTSSSISGMHKQVTIPTPLGADPSLTGTYGEFYTKEVSGTVLPFFANSSTVYSLTGSGTASANGSVTLPAGVIFKWGTISVNSGNSVAITFGTAFPNNLWQVIFSPTSAPARASSANATDFTPSGFNLISIAFSPSSTYSYLAIGN